MKRKHPNTIPMEEMTQDLLDKAYSCEMSKEQLLKMFSDCIEKKWMEEEDLSQRYKFYLEIICAMYKLHRNMNYGIDITSLYALLNHNHLDIDFNKYAEVIAVVCMILEGEVCTSTQCGEFYDLRKQYQIHNNFQLTILGMIYLVEKENT